LVSERCVRPDRVVVPPPALDDDLGLAESVEDFAVEQLVALHRVDTRRAVLRPADGMVIIQSGQSKYVDPAMAKAKAYCISAIGTKWSIGLQKLQRNDLFLSSVNRSSW